MSRRYLGWELKVYLGVTLGGDRRWGTVMRYRGDLVCFQWCIAVLFCGGKGGTHKEDSTAQCTATIDGMYAVVVGVYVCVNVGGERHQQRVYALNENGSSIHHVPDSTFGKWSWAGLLHETSRNNLCITEVFHGKHLASSENMSPAVKKSLSGRVAYGMLFWEEQRLVQWSRPRGRSRALMVREDGSLAACATVTRGDDPTSVDTCFKKKHFFFSLQKKIQTTVSSQLLIAPRKKT